MRVFLTGRSQREKDEKSGSSNSLVDEERKVSEEQRQQASSPDVDERWWSRKRPRLGRSTSPPQSPFEGCDPPDAERPHKRLDRGEEHSDQESASVDVNDGRGSGLHIPRESSVERPETGREMGGGGRLIEPACERRKKGDGPERPEGDNGGEDGRREASSAATSSGVHGGDARGHSRPQTAKAKAAQQKRNASSSSTILTSRRQRQIEPQDQDDDWEESKTEIILKSTEDYMSAGAFTSCANVSSSNGEGRGLILNRPVAGSSNDPATVSKSDYVSSRSRSATASVDANPSEPLDTTLREFLRLLRTRHRPSLEVVEMDGDGNCLFRAISLQVYGDQSNHGDVRSACLDFMERESAHYRNFVADEDFADYVSRKRRDRVHGNHAEIQAMSELYNRSIEVFVPANGIEPINIFHKDYKGDDPPIRLCYMDGNHYDAIIDPLVPTAGLGLGLPGLEPGLADKLQVQQAKRASDEAAKQQNAKLMKSAMAESEKASKKREELELQETIRKSEELFLGDNDFYSKKKALYLSDLDSADFDLEQAVLASSLESYRQAEQERKPSSRGGRGRHRGSPRGGGSPLHHRPVAAAASSNSHAPSSVTAGCPASGKAVAASSKPSSELRSGSSLTADQYPPAVQELIMNGFESSKVLHAYDLVGAAASLFIPLVLFKWLAWGSNSRSFQVGDSFDDLLAFLLSTTT
mmetsp:Transcript_27922/g.66526  ORF Transcript_27922/g.66526 Transcript_27922/m.66526 type:complete len:697 (-) Transcript_27922:440-2530(-)